MQKYEEICNTYEEILKSMGVLRSGLGGARGESERNLGQGQDVAQVRAVHESREGRVKSVSGWFGSGQA